VEDQDNCPIIEGKSTPKWLMRFMINRGQQYQTNGKSNLELFQY
jgi:hypothetical protein